MICENTQICFFELLKTHEQIKCEKKPLCVDFCDKRMDATCKERGRFYHLINIKDKRCKVLSLHIDGGVIIEDKKTPPNVSKCDYLYLIEVGESPIAILIELKGTNLLKAVEQIESTIALFKDVFNKCKKVYGRIVFTGGTPNIQNIPAVISLARKIKKRGGNLIAAEKVIDKIENLC